MDDVLQFPGQSSDGVELLPAEIGLPVKVEGRAVPNLRAVIMGENVEFILDGRYSYTVPKSLSKIVAAAMANSMAIGAGYASVSADAPMQGFAPEVFEIEVEP